MNVTRLELKKVNQYVPYLFLIGAGIGTTNYVIHKGFNWFQWVVLSTSTSFFVGYVLLLVAANKAFFTDFLKLQWMRYGFLALFFVLVGMLSTEVESLIKHLFFLKGDYVPFSSGNLYLSNSIIATFLGFSFFLNDRLFQVKRENVEDAKIELSEPVEEVSKEAITTIPVKQGEHIQLINIADIVYFEAFDNYSYLHHKSGKKMLCDYPLVFLEKRLGKDFLRIHRKYIVHTVHIQQIIPHLNGRYLIRFDHPQLDDITSSKGYLKTMQKLVKIE